MYTSVTLWEVTAPVKLPLTSCLFLKKLSKIEKEGWYFTDAYAPIYTTQNFQLYNFRS